MTRARALTQAGRSGFTLIELLIAMSLMALIALALSGALGFGSRVWETGTAVADDDERLAATQTMLRRLLAQAAAPGEGAGELAADEAPLNGASAELRFWASVPAYLGQGGHYRFRLFVQDIDGERDLRMTWRPIRAPAAEEESTVLLTGIEALAIRYLAPPDENGIKAWQESWQDPDAFPTLIEIAVAFPAGDRRSFPRLAVAPRLSP